MRRDTLRPLLLLLTGGCGSAVSRGDDALGQGRYGEAIAHYEAARANGAADDVPTERLASAHRALAQGHLAAGQCGPARDALSVADGLTPAVLADHRALYECDAAAGAPVEVQVTDLQRLLALGDPRASVVRALYTLEDRLGRSADALSRLEALDTRGVLGLEERKLLVRQLIDAGRVEQARAHLERVVAVEPFDPVLRLKLAELDERSGRKDRARETYEQLARDFPKNPIAHQRLAGFLRSIGDTTAAAEAQARADALRPSPPPPRDDLRPLRKSRR